MELRKEMKNDARALLHRCWVRAVSVLLIAAALWCAVATIEGTASALLAEPAPVEGYEDLSGMVRAALAAGPQGMAITGVAALLEFAIQAPLAIGRRRWYIEAASGAPASVTSIFRQFATPEKFFRALGFELLLSLKKLLWALLFVGPGAALAAFAWGAGSGGMMERAGVSGTLINMFMLAGIAMALLGALLWAVVTQRYFLAPYYLAERLTIRQAFAKSVEATGGEHAAIFMFKFSFIGWWALCWFVLPLLYVEPYYSTSAGIYARYLMERNDRVVRV